MVTFNKNIMYKLTLKPLISEKKDRKTIYCNSENVF